MRDIKINYKLNKSELIYEKIQIKIINELNKILSEKKIEKKELIELTGLNEVKINNILNNRLEKITIKDLCIVSFVLNLNPEELFNVKIFKENTLENGYSKGFIDGLYYAIQIIKNIDSKIDISKVLDMYNKLN